MGEGCWPANVVSAFFIALIVFDLIQKDWVGLPGHIIAGLVLVIVFFVLCWIVGPQITGAVLVVPGVFLVIFLFAVWLTNTYGTPKQSKGSQMFKGLAYLVRKDGVCVDSATPYPGTGSTGSQDGDASSKCVTPSLNATTKS
jgi:hypothetical protein